jgi:NADP-dependent 3-hydroxy acid dehydrogenase YdfG
VVERALDRFGRIDSLIKNAGIFVGKPFTDYTADDYAAATTVNLAGSSTSPCALSGRWSDSAAAMSST